MITTSLESFQECLSSLSSVFDRYLQSLPTASSPALPVHAHHVSSSRLLHELPTQGLGLSQATSHLLHELLPGLNNSSLSPHYYGFVTGGVTPAALLADLAVSAIDQNVQVHLPAETLSTVVEDRALVMLLELFDLKPSEWPGRTFTTGATASNILGLSCAREALLPGVGELGLLEVVRRREVAGIQILAAQAHSSVAKAAAVVGLGRGCVKSVESKQRPWEIDLSILEEALRRGEEAGMVSIVMVGYGEVNTGMFAGDMKKIRQLVDRGKGRVWIHVDAAFGIFARLLGQAEGLEYADSIAGDGHKVLNVPYDCGFFFTKSIQELTSTLVNAAPYLSASSSESSIPAPLNINLENSRRFRALPVYASLAAYGKEGYRGLIQRLVKHARGIASVIQSHSGFELLPSEFIVVLFRARDEALNQELKERINAGGRIYVSGTMWDGKPAVRCAVSNWRVSGDYEGGNGWGIVEEVLDEIAPR